MKKNITNSFGNEFCQTSTLVSEQKSNNNFTTTDTNSAPNNAQINNVAKKENRTKAKAGETAEIPSHLPIITLRDYQNALSFYQCGNAYLLPLSDTSGLSYRNNILIYKGLPATLTTLSNLGTVEDVDKFNLSLLWVLYSIIHNKYSQEANEPQKAGNIVTFYFPDLTKQTGRTQKINKAAIQECINDISQFKTVFGIIRNEKNNAIILPVINHLEYDNSKNTISFSSPYISRIIREIYEAGTRKDKKGNALLKKNGMPQMLPTHSYLIDMSIVKEKNKKALEIVFAVIILIEQAGKNTPHIRADKLIERCPFLHKSLQEQTTGNKNNLLKRAFTKAWELLRQKTYLSNVYKNIKLPDPGNPLSIPTSSALDRVFSFPHNGKSRND